ncbi:hypothetical protein [Armatimonas sp.]|uniref:hypothetical protein n=1 Tax=Armatimonas sp. TaxID=1872638 RepID=UPI00286C520B|nr:hypothetical protein [Armatimonas sp.]
MTEFITRRKTILHFDPSDISEYLIHGDQLLEQLLAELAGPAYSKLSIAARRRRMAAITWPWWSEQVRKHLGRKDAELFHQKIAADLLEWGRGLVQCPACEVPHLGSELTVREWRCDGFDHREFRCPANQVVFVTGQGNSGELDSLGDPLPLPDPPFGRYLYPAKHKNQVYQAK